MPIWSIVNTGTTLILISTILMEAYYLIVADNLANLNLEGFAINGIIFVSALQQIFTLHAYEKDPMATTYMVSTMFNMCGHPCHKNGNKGD